MIFLSRQVSGVIPYHSTVIHFRPVFSKKNIIGGLCDGVMNNSLQDEGLFYEFVFCALSHNVWFELSLISPLRIGCINQGGSLVLGLCSVDNRSLNLWALD